MVYNLCDSSFQVFDAAVGPGPSFDPCPYSYGIGFPLKWAKEILCNLVAWIIPKDVLSLCFSTSGTTWMPNKFNATRRHKFDKAQYRVIHWAEYNESLRQRGI